MCTVGILGLGAIGSVVASTLVQNASVRLHFFNRSHRDRIGVEGPSGNFELPIHMHTSPPADVELDWLIVCLKEHHFKDAHRWFNTLIKPNTNVVVIRNGLHHTAPILKYTSAENCAPCTIDCPAQLNGDGVYTHLYAPKLTLPNTELATNFAVLFENSDAELNLVEDFKTVAWKKVCESSALGGTLCSYRQPCSVFENREAIEYFKKLLHEAIEVAKADGAKIEADFAVQMVEKVLQYPPSKGSSMLSDLVAGKTLEMGAKNGLICKIGEELNIKTFHNRILVNKLTQYF